jgi:drug/metabolite transporter (DMT)-like permease
MTDRPGDWRLGFMFALVTASAWGLLPIALKAMLTYMDPYTITWFRFLVAAMIAGPVLWARGSLPRLGRLDRRGLILLSVAVAGLIGNYVLYLLGLSHATPASAQVLVQLAPLFLLVGGLVIFREPFSHLQWAGLATLLLGLGIFFHDRLDQLIDPDADLARGVALIVLASLVWAAYGIAQKLLQGRMTAQSILLVIYVAASLALLPASAPARLSALSPWAWFLLAFCSINTLVAYGSFAEALRHWQASRVSAVLALTPLLTVGFGALLTALPTGYVSEDSLDTASVLGAVIVVMGSAVCALGGTRRRNPG